MTDQQKLIRVNSRYKTNGTNGNFTMNFDSKDLYQCKGVALARATLNRTFPNIYSPINTLWLTIDSNDAFITVPQGQYTATTLAAAIQAASSGQLTVTYDSTNNRFVFTYLGMSPPVVLKSDST